MAGESKGRSKAVTVAPPDPRADPPLAPRRPTTLRHGDDTRVDEWFWLRERDDPEVIAYLEAENAYTRAALAHTEDLQTRLFDEIVARVQETDATAPVRKGDWEYFTRTREGLQYGQHCRRPAGTPGLPDPAATAGSPPGEHLLLDENELSGDSGYFALGGVLDLARAGPPRVLDRPHRWRALHVARPLLRRRKRRRCPDGSRRRDPRRVLRRGVGQRRRDRLLHAARRRDAPLPGVAPHDRHAGRRRRARLRGGRRAVLRLGRPHANRALPDRDVGVEADDRGLVRRREHTGGAVVTRCAARRGRRIPRRAPLEPGTRRPVLHPHERRRRSELRAAGCARRDARTGPLGDRCRPPARRPPRGRRRVRGSSRALRARRRTRATARAASRPNLG